ncbi:MAG TPA: DUF488 domain-containing protein [Kiritimatiellia bacterium]|nr:DUF488 domain-containing protein [Kiritimatiellia bacterium]
MIAPKQQSRARTLFTIGYEGLNTADFLKYLDYHRIEVLVDVRELAFSRKRGFSKTALRTATEQAGVQYVHIRELGSPREDRHELKESWDYKSFFKAYRRHLEDQSDAIDSLLDLLAENDRVCLMCFEKEHEKCHRSSLAAFISEQFEGALKVEPVKTWVK